MAWSVPTVAVSISAPALASSGPCGAPVASFGGGLELQWPSNGTETMVFGVGVARVDSLAANVTVTKIVAETWFVGRLPSGTPGSNIPIWNSATGSSAGGVGVSNRRSQSAGNLPWSSSSTDTLGATYQGRAAVGAQGGWSPVASSTTTSLTNFTYLDGTTAPSWNLIQQWDASRDANIASRYTTTASGCRNFNAGASGQWVDRWTSTKPVPAGTTLRTAFTWQTAMTYYLSNGCRIVGEAGFMRSSGTGGISRDGAPIC